MKVKMLKVTTYTLNKKLTRLEKGDYADVETNIATRWADAGICEMANQPNYNPPPPKDYRKFKTSELKEEGERLGVIFSDPTDRMLMISELKEKGE
jgi:hypothetical protein